MRRDRPDTGALQNLTLILAGLAGLAMELAVSASVGFGIMNGAAVAVLVAAAVLANFVLRRGFRGAKAVAAVLLVTACGADLARLVALGDHLPVEVLVVALFRDAAVGMAALSVRPVLLRCAGGATAALILFAACLADNPLALVLLGLYAVVGSLWLSFLYWGLVRRDLLPGTSRRLPAVATALAWAALLGVVAVIAVGPRRVIAALGELMPTSGGTSDYDSRSRGGVNDGDALTAATQAPQSTGLVQSEIFLESHERTLYDAASDMYGKPRKRNEQQQAVALSNVTVQEVKKPTENQQASRSFALSRHRPIDPGQPRDMPSDALFFVNGPTPLHLRLMAYARLTPDALEEAPPEFSQLDLGRGMLGWLTVEEAPEVAARKRPWFAGNVTHEFKLAKLQAAQLLTPPHLSGFRLEKVDRPDLFRRSQPGILRLNDGQVPRGMVLETDARTLDPARLGGEAFPEGGHYAHPVYRATDDVSSRVQELARAWASDLPRGWDQVQAIVQRLKQDYTHERPAPALPKDTDDLTLPDGVSELEQFLFATRKGPDYLFATAAAVLLRELDYPTRVVGGFYADPARYDERTSHTPVFEADLHFWPEVMLAGDEWAVLEPTPGYETMGPSPTLLSRLIGALIAVKDGLLANLIPLGVVVILGGVLVWRRRQVLNVVATLWWRGTASAPPRRHVLTTLWLLERRARWSGRPRPRGQTPRRWFAREDLVFFLDLTDWALYAPPGDDKPPCSAGEVRRRCENAVRNSRFPSPLQG